MTRSLFGRTFAVMLLSHTAVVLVLSGVFVFAVQQSIERWNADRGQQVKNLMIPEIVRLYRQTGRLSEDQIHAALLPFLTDSVSVYALNAEREPVYLYLKGQMISIHEPAELAAGVAEMRQITPVPATILDGPNAIGYLYVDTASFRDDLTNTRLLRSLFNIVTGGAATAFAGALLVAFIVSRLLVTQAQSLSRGIERLAAGDREVVFPQEGPRELLVIAQSARALRDQLANEEQLRKRWTEDIAHDLRTPITALKTQFEGITDGYITMTPQRLEDLKNELNHVERLVNDLRELSWVESPEMHLEKTRVDLRTFVGNVTTVFTGRSKKLAVPFHVVSEDGTIEADEYLLQRALTNVIDNAFRYVASGGSVQFSGGLNAVRCVFEVKNTGTIPDDEVERVFERFYRGTNSAYTHGSGLGLSVTAAIVEAHGGSAGIVQEDDTTVLRIVLPNSSAD